MKITLRKIITRKARQSSQEFSQFILNQKLEIFKMLFLNMLSHSFLWEFYFILFLRQDLTVLTRLALNS